MHASEITDAQWVSLRNRLVKTFQKKPLHISAEDLTQHALLKLWESTASFEDAVHVFHWCVKVAFYYALNQHRQQKRECFLDVDILDTERIDCTSLEFLVDLNRMNPSTTLLEWSMGHTLQDLSTKCGISIPAVHKRIKTELKCMSTRMEC